MGGACGKGFAAKSARTSGVVREQAAFRTQDEWIIAPLAERREPQVPIEARLIGRVDARSFVQLLRLMPEGIGDPCFAVVGALEFDFVAAARHHGEKAIAIGDAKGIEQRDREWWEKARARSSRSSARWWRRKSRSAKSRRWLHAGARARNELFAIDYAGVSISVGADPSDGLAAGLESRVDQKRARSTRRQV